MLKDNYKIEVKVNSERPDFRIFGVFLWDENHNYDSEGNSFNPASKTWTELYMSSREIPNQRFDLNMISIEPLVLEVSSSNQEFLNRVAYLLKKETNGETNESDKDLIDNMGTEFNLKTALKRAENSIWRMSTLENPYPNL